VKLPFNCVVTNVPGPQVPLYSAGARLVTQYGLGPVYDGMGLIFPVFSYCGHINVAFNACREMVPDPEFLAECLEASYADLSSAAGSS
jgi:diacylglycerol O-acyltransferase